MHLDVETQLSDVGKGGPGRHPLPGAAALARLLGAAGIGDDTLVIAYDDAGGTAAARLWWLLALHGHPRAQVLDGGLAAFVAAGGTVTKEVPSPSPRSFTSRPPLVRVVDRGAVIEAIGRGALLLDARAAERYEGKEEPIDKRPGHIPTARNAPFAQNLDAHKHFLAPAALRAAYEALGASSERIANGDVVAYCGSGITAAHVVLAVVVAGLGPPLLYEGSWSDWIHDGTQPVAMGAEPRLSIRRR